MTNLEWINNRKIPQSRSYMCKEDQLLLYTHFHENCVVKLLQPKRTLPNTCVKRIVELNNSVWIHLDNNEWVYFIPNTDSITVVCRDKELVEITMMGGGKLSLISGRKLYSKSAVLQIHPLIKSSYSNKRAVIAQSGF
jgi:hypothetical protein